MAPWHAATVRGRSVGALALALVAAGVVWRYPVVAAVGLVLAVVVVAEVVAVLRSPQTGLRRTVEPLVVVRRGPCRGHLRVIGGGGGGLVRHEAAERVDGELVPIRLVDGAETTYSIPTRRRGVLEVGPVRLRRQSLSGMASRSMDVGDVVSVRVLPRRVELTLLPAGHRRALTGGDDSLELGGTDLVGLHEYTMGDDLRRLHWATSARTGTLMVREDADPAEPHLCVVLDDRTDSYERADDFEEAVELVAALCRVAVEGGYPLRFRSTSGRDEIVVPGSSSRQPRQEGRDVEWLLAEVDTVPGHHVQPVDRRDLDVVVAVTGGSADLAPLTLALGTALDTTVCVVEEHPLVTAGRQGTATVLRGRGSQELARLWDERAAR